MKKFIYIAIALAALMSCAKETSVDSVSAGPESKYININISADRQPDVKTVIDVPNRTLLWGDDEHLAVYELRWEDGSDGYAWNGDAVVSEKGVSSDGGHTMTFKATFEAEANTSGQDLIYTAVYPASAMEGVKGGYFQGIHLASIQNDEEGSFDPSADLLLAEQQPFPDQQTDLHFTFKRLVALTRVKVKNIDPLCYQVAGVKLITPGHTITGRKNLSLTGGFVTNSETTRDLDNSVKVNVKDRNLLSSSNSAPSEFDVWFCMWPTTLYSGDTFTLVVSDIYGREFTREVTITGSPLEFKAGKVTKFTVDMSTATASEALNSYYRKIQFPSGNPMGGLTLSYKDSWKSGIRFYSYSDWEIKVEGGDGWLTISDSYSEIGSTHLSGHGTGIDQRNTIQLVPNLRAPYVGEYPRTATVTVSNDTDEKSFTITQENYWPLKGIAFEKDHYDVVAGETVQVVALPTPATAHGYKLTFISYNSQVAHPVDESSGVYQGNSEGTIKIEVMAQDQDSREQFWAEATLTVTAPPVNRPEHVYMAMTSNVEPTGAFMVLDGVPTALEGVGTTQGIVLAGDDVYITGTTSERIDSNTTLYYACYWKNGVQTTLPAYRTISDPVADGNDVYVIVNWLDSESGDNRYAVLKNWEKIAESEEDATWRFLAVENGNWYVAGYEITNMKTSLWSKDGKTVIDTLTPNCITVKDGKVYVGGSVYNKCPDAALWVDGQLTQFTANTSRPQNDDIRLILVSGSDVWAIGHHWYQSTTNVPYFYKNGQRVIVPTMLKDNGNQSFDRTDFVAGQMYDGYPYVLASVSMESNVFRNSPQILWSTQFFAPEYVNPEQTKYMYTYKGISYTGMFLK